MPGFCQRDAVSSFPARVGALSFTAGLFNVLSVHTRRVRLSSTSSPAKAGASSIIADHFLLPDAHLQNEVEQHKLDTQMSTKEELAVSCVYGGRFIHESEQTLLR
eukprot:1159373-Pelagomonas_calceolata.AAC.1